jgi:hypothetical protein
MQQLSIEKRSCVGNTWEFSIKLAMAAASPVFFLYAINIEALHS